MRWGIVKERSFGRPDGFFGQYTPILQCSQEAVWFISFLYASFPEHATLFPCLGVAVHTLCSLRHILRDP